MKRLLFLTGWLLCLCPAIMAAELKSEAGRLIKQTVDQALAILQNPAIKTPGPEQDKLMAEISALVYKRIDFEEFSARAVGAKWRDFAPSQKENFLAAFSDLLYYTYYSSVDKYSGQPIEFTGEILSAKGDKAEIKSNFYFDGKAFPINYRMMSKDGDWLLYDIYIESISIVQNYRNQFQDILQKQSIDELIKRVRDKADETKTAALNASPGR